MSFFSQYQRYLKELSEIGEKEELTFGQTMRGILEAGKNFAEAVKVETEDAAAAPYDTKRTGDRK